MQGLKQFAPVLICCSTLGSMPDAIAQNENEAECGPDELDMGDYCVSVIPAEPEEAAGRKVTPFRKSSMMPGIAREPNSGEFAMPGVVRTGPAPRTWTANDVLGVQLGVFSKKMTAEMIARSVVETGTTVVLSPVENAEGTLWACIAGPYADYDTASATALRLRQDKRFREAWIKPLEGMQLEGLVYDSTEE